MTEIMEMLLLFHDFQMIYYQKECSQSNEFSCEALMFGWKSALRICGRYVYPKDLKEGDWIIIQNGIINVCVGEVCRIEETTIKRNHPVYEGKEYYIDCNVRHDGYGTCLYADSLIPVIDMEKTESVFKKRYEYKNRYALA